MSKPVRALNGTQGVRSFSLLKIKPRHLPRRALALSTRMNVECLRTWPYKATECSITSEFSFLFCCIVFISASALGFDLKPISLTCCNLCESQFFVVPFLVIPLLTMLKVTYANVTTHTHLKKFSENGQISVCCAGTVKISFEGIHFIGIHFICVI